MAKVRVTTRSGAVVKAWRSGSTWVHSEWDGSPPVGVNFDGLELTAEQRDSTTFKYSEVRRPGRGFTSVSDSNTRSLEEHLASVEAYVRGLVADQDIPT